MAANKGCQKEKEFCRILPLSLRRAAYAMVPKICARGCSWPIEKRGCVLRAIDGPSRLAGGGARTATMALLALLFGSAEPTRPDTAEQQRPEHQRQAR